jgi:peptidoglycan/xylan/chitin deacetylase (PgdA/CDA1 family)
VPSFQQHLDTLEAWRRFPGLERLEPLAGAPRVALSFDDGPDPDSTPAVLDALDEAGVTATFFVVGEQLERHWQIAREAQARGHELGLHGHGHPAHHVLSPAGARDEVARGVGAFEAALGRRPALFRPPYGRFSEASFAACGSLSLRPVYWSAWGMDWEEIGPDRIAELSCRDLADGMVLLLHDSARYASRRSALPTAQSIARIAVRARELGLAVGPITMP